MAQQPSTVTKSQLTKALKANKGNIAFAARELGVARTTVYKLCDRHGVNPVAFRPKAKRA